MNSSLVIKWIKQSEDGGTDYVPVWHSFPSFKESV